MGLLELVEELERTGVRYALIGGLATGYRSRPRFTRDADFLLQIPLLTLPGLLENLHVRGFAFDAQTTIREWIKEHITVLSFRGVRIDWLAPVIPLYQHVLNTAVQEIWFGHSVRIASPEGLILMKLVAFRGQDQIDIENLLAANRGQLDLDTIRREWESVSNQDDPRMRRFNEMVDQFNLSNG